MKKWMICAVETELEWPAEEKTISFMGQTLILRPQDGNSATDIRLQYEHPQSERDAYETISRFLSALSWWQRRPAHDRLRFGCTAPMRVGKGGYGPALCKDYYLPNGVQSPSDTKPRLAIALYREAISVNSTPYEFLGYFKIINVRYNGKMIISWINSAIPRLTDRRAKDRISELTALQSDLGEYLYGSGRCAVAHAFGDVVVDPDNPDDLIRLNADMPVARALAEYLIETELGIPWESSKGIAQVQRFGEAKR